VTPSLAGYTFAPPNRAYAQVNETLTGQDYDASAAPAPGVLGVAPADGLASSGYVGGPFTPATKQYTLTNTGGSPLTWTAGATQGWVTLSGTGGPLAAGASTSVTVTINSNANSLDAGSYGDTVTVTNATNGQGNTTRPVSLAVNPGSPGNCITSTSAWQNTSFASQSGAFTAEFDAIPSAPFSGADGVTALSATAGAQYSDYAVLVRFNDAGRIDARNGGTYGAVNVINYTGGTNYHFRLVVNVPAHTYSAYVTPQGAAEQVLALNYSFRTEQAGVVSLANWGLIGAAGWTHQVCNFVVSTSGGQPPYTYSWSPATGLSDPTLAQPTASPAITTTYTLTVTDSEGDTAADGALVTVVVGNLYYVATNDPNASDSNPGTEALPWKTLTKAANTAQAGDTVLVRAGTYNESLTLTHSGTVDAPITFSNHNGAAVVIDGQHSRPSNVTVQNANYVIVSGFEMVHAASNAVVLQNTQHVQVLNNHVHDGDSRGIVLRQGSLGARIAYNEVNNMQDDPLMNWLEYNPSIRYDDTIIEHNYLHDCFVGHSDGIQWVAPSANTIIRYNVVADTTQNIYIAPDHLNVDSLEIYGNVVYNQNYNTWGKGIYVVATAGSDATITNVSIHSNTIGHHSVGWCVLLQGDLSNVSFRNNIFSTDGDSAINLANNADDPNQISLDYNLYWRPDVGANALIVWGGWYDTLAQFKSAHPGQEVHGVEANPLFVNESGHNYHLNASSSPAFNAGTNVGTGPDFDGWERPWSGGWDLGAFEYH
jgi:hypothetical protein